MRAVAHADGARAGLGDPHVVGHQHHRRAQARVQILQQSQDLLARAGVEVAGRLVAQQDRWVDRQRARNRHALALSAREFLGQMVGARGPRPTVPSSSCARARAFARGQPRRCNGSATFSRADSVGSRLKNWKTKPILSRRTRVRSSSASDASGWPST